MKRQGGRERSAEIQTHPQLSGGRGESGVLFVHHRASCAFSTFYQNGNSLPSPNRVFPQILAGQLSKDGEGPWRTGEFINEQSNAPKYSVEASASAACLVSLPHITMMLCEGENRQNKGRVQFCTPGMVLAAATNNI